MHTCTAAGFVLFLGGTGVSLVQCHLYDRVGILNLARMPPHNGLLFRRYKDSVNGQTHKTPGKGEADGRENRRLLTIL